MVLAECSRQSYDNAADEKLNVQTHGRFHFADGVLGNGDDMLFSASEDSIDVRRIVRYLAIALLNRLQTSDDGFGDAFFKITVAQTVDALLCDGTITGLSNGQEISDAGAHGFDIDGWLRIRSGARDFLLNCFRIVEQRDGVAGAVADLLIF